MRRVDTWDARRVTYSAKMSKYAQFGTFTCILGKTSKLWGIVEHYCKYRSSLISFD